MQGFVDTLLSDWGILGTVIVALLLLSVSAWWILIGKGYKRESSFTTPGGVTTTRLEIVMGNQSKFVYVLLAIVFIVISWAGLGFWNEISSGIPYVSDATYNLIVESIVVIVLVSMFMMALVFVRQLGWLEAYKKR